MIEYEARQLYPKSTIFVVKKHDKSKKTYGIFKIIGTEYEDCFARWFEEDTYKEINDEIRTILEHEAAKTFFNVK